MSVPINIKNCTIKIKDGTSPTPNSISVKIGAGNLTFTEARNLNYNLDRDQLDDVTEGEEIPIDVTLDFQWRFIKASSGDPATPVEAIKGIGAASTWESTDSNGCASYAVDLEIEYTPPCSDAQKETILLSDFRWDRLEYDPRSAQVSCAGRCNVTQATITRAAQS